MDECDFCGAEANLVCSECLQAVYCSEKCQHADHTEHAEECIHPSKMTDEQVADEIQVHLDHPFEDDEIVGDSIFSDDPRDWLLQHIGLNLKRRVNRRRVKSQKTGTRRKIRRARRETRKANRGKRNANQLARKKKQLFTANTRKEKARGREDVATQRAL